MKQDKGLTAKDTVMDRKERVASAQYDSMSDDLPDWAIRALKAQAEITWDKAKAHYEPLIAKAFKEGVDKTHKACDKTYGEMLKAERERTEGLLDVHENELGFCEISNHVPYSNFKGGN